MTQLQRSLCTMLAALWVVWRSATPRGNRQGSTSLAARPASGVPSQQCTQRRVSPSQPPILSIRRFCCLLARWCSLGAAHFRSRRSGGGMLRTDRSTNRNPSTCECDHVISRTHVSRKRGGQQAAGTRETADGLLQPPLERRQSNPPVFSSRFSGGMGSFALIFTYVRFPYPMPANHRSQPGAPVTAPLLELSLPLYSFIHFPNIPVVYPALCKCNPKLFGATRDV